MGESYNYKRIDKTEGETCINYNGWLYRYIILGVVSMICFGNYFDYDVISPLETRILANVTEGGLQITKTEFGLLYSVYSIPNTVLVFFGGLLGDKIGLRLAGSIYSALVVLGAILVALGPMLAGHGLDHKNAFIMMCAGRVVFGCGAESLNVIQTSMVSVWFKGGRELAMSLGIVLSISRLGDFLALSESVQIASIFGDPDKGWKDALWVGAVLCAISFGATVIYGFLDRLAEPHLINREPPPEENPLNFKAVLHFDARFWLISFCCMTYYGGVFPFTAICSNFLQTKYHYLPTPAGYIASIITLSSMVLSPFIGKLFDVIGYRPYFIVLGSCMILPMHLLLAFTDITPIPLVIIIGLSFSLVPAALWPSVPMIIKNDEVATAFGVMTAIQNAGLACINAGAGALAEVSYFWSMILFAAFDALGLVFGICLLLVDRSKDRKLCSVNKKKNTDGELPVN